MKKSVTNQFTKFTFLAASVLMAGGMVSCSEDKNEIRVDELSSKEHALQKAMLPYIEKTVVPTYRGMADNAILMADACRDMLEAFEKGSLTADMVKIAGEYWNLSRDYWEKSEAFLFGAAADYNIDPHIDSWPLDKNAMDDLLVDLRNGRYWNIDNAGYGLLGFHAVEYMLYELSEDENISLTHNLNYKEEELTYLCAVAEDLRNQCIYLEASWAGIDNVTPEKRAILEEAELYPSMNYGEMMINAGKAGSRYKTYQEAAEELIQGCIDIADEVGNTKIGRPVLGSSSEDKNYIESPYSLNSIADFTGNIISIRNAYCGIERGDASVSDYIKSVNPELDSRLRSQIEEAIDVISLIPEPFAKFAASDANAAKAVKVVGTDLVDVLEEVMTEISRH